jgi:hypothetical protein
VRKKLTIHSIDQIRLVCFDVDHTLLSDEQQLLPLTEDTLRKLQARGIKIILATGKNLAATRDIVDRLKLDDPLIFANGSLIQYRNGEILSQKDLKPERTRQILQLGDAKGLDMMLYVTNDTIVKEGGKFLHALDRYGGPKSKEVAQWQDIGTNLDHILKIVFIDEEYNKLVEMSRILETNIPDGIETCFSLPILLEVQPEGVSKGSALEEVTHFLKLPREALIAFGDGNNDIEMIQFAGIGVALENATPELKKVANYVVASNNEEGPAQFLRDIFILR